ncbi:MAG: 50S ribosomal protein L6 [Chloroflexota bacterium]|nr:50S ribosomal protein L6 [Chloroflexota bacterium]MDP6508939.1 50S ribosomal protein L6 [Chloroflexota bacterium]
MSRVGERPIPLPDGVEWSQADGTIEVTGSLGKLAVTLQSCITVREEDRVLIVTRESDERRHRELHGLSRTLVANMVDGVSQGVRKTLDIVGTGYRVEEHPTGIEMQLGFSHPVIFAAPEGVELVVEGNNRVQVRGIDKELIGRTAAELRMIRPPDAYKGKGIRYSDEVVRTKPGKAAIGALDA